MRKQLLHSVENNEGWASDVLANLGYSSGS